MEYLEIFPVIEEVFIDMSELEQYAHTFPFGSDEDIEHGITTDFFIALVVELSGSGVVAEGVIFGIVPAVYTEFYSEDIADEFEFVEPRKVSACERERNYRLVSTPL